MTKTQANEPDFVLVHSVIREIVVCGENIASDAGVGSSETAGVIVSFLAERPSLMPSFMAGTLSPVDVGMLDHHNGVLSWHGQDGGVHQPDPSKARFPAPAPERLPDRTAYEAIGFGVESKALEWDEDSANTPIGRYVIRRTPDGYEVSFNGEEIAHLGYDAPRAQPSARDAARNYAQADFERRVLSCLSSAPVEEADAKTGEASWIANCVRCGRIVDTREEKDGGDKFGCELSRGGWTCSFECWEAEVDAADDGAGPYGGAKADEEDTPSAPTIPSEPEAKGEAGAGPVGEVLADFVSVPREPTQAMLNAGRNAADDHRWKWCGYGKREPGQGLDGMEFHVREAYRAMVAIARPAEEPGEVGEDDEETTLKDRVENAVQAMSETHDSWESRCHAIMAALGFNFGWEGAKRDAGPVGEAVAQAKVLSHRVLTMSYRLECGDRYSIPLAEANLAVDAARDMKAALAARPVEEPGEVERLTRERDDALHDIGVQNEQLRDMQIARETAEAALAESEQNAQGLASDLAGTQAELAETRERLEKLEAAVRPIVEASIRSVSDEVDIPDSASGAIWITMGEVRAIRAALTGDAQEGGK